MGLPFGLAIKILYAGSVRLCDSAFRVTLYKNESLFFVQIKLH